MQTNCFIRSVFARLSILDSSLRAASFLRAAVRNSRAVYCASCDRVAGARCSSHPAARALSTRSSTRSSRLPPSLRVLPLHLQVALNRPAQQLHIMLSMRPKDRSLRSQQCPCVAHIHCTHSTRTRLVSERPTPAPAPAPTRRRRRLLRYRLRLRRRVAASRRRRRRLWRSRRSAKKIASQFQRLNSATLILPPAIRHRLLEMADLRVRTTRMLHARVHSSPIIPVAICTLLSLGRLWQCASPTSDVCAHLIAGRAHPVPRTRAQVGHRSRNSLARTAATSPSGLRHRLLLRLHVRKKRVLFASVCTPSTTSGSRGWTASAARRRSTIRTYILHCLCSSLPQHSLIPKTQNHVHFFLLHDILNSHES